MKFSRVKYVFKLIINKLLGKNSLTPNHYPLSINNYPLTINHYKLSIIHYPLSIYNLSFIILLALPSCSKKKDLIPENILSRQKMEQIILDFQIIDASYKYHQTEKQNLKFDPRGFYEKVYEKNSISKMDFERSLDYYSQHPDVLEEIYSSVLDELTSLEAEQSIVASP